MALIDTSASVSMMWRPLYQKVQQVSQMRLQTQDTPQLEGVGGNPVPTLGHADVHVGIGDAAVRDWLTPGSVKDVQAFLGLASYYRPYIPNFASVATPLTGLTKKDAKLIWDDDCEQTVQSLKKALVQPPVLAYPTRDGHFVLSTEASDMGMGAVLEQEQAEGSRVVKRVIAYASKTLNAS